MTVNVNEKESGVFVLAPEGALDYVTSAEFDEVIVSTAEKAEKLIIDMGGITYISSAGLRVLLSADDLMSDKGGLVVVNINDYVRDILKMTGLLGALTIE